MSPFSGAIRFMARIIEGEKIASEIRAEISGEVAALAKRGVTPGLAVVLVGALNVSSISTVSLGEIASGAPRRWREQPPLALARGAELGRFNLGSTVVLLFGRGAVRWDSRLATGAPIRMGEPLGRLAAEARGALLPEAAR